MQNQSHVDRDGAKERLATAANVAGDKVASRLDTQKERVAGELGGVAQALRQASDQLRDQSQAATAPEYVASAATQVERLSNYLRSTNTKEIVHGVEEFARRQPALFVGGTFVLGLFATRFLKSSGGSRLAQSSTVASAALEPSISTGPDTQNRAGSLGTPSSATRETGTRSKAARAASGEHN